MLYQPTPAEISTAVASAARRHPELASRIEKAGEILRDGSLQLDQLAWDMRAMVRWKIASQSGRGTYVVVNGGCPCQDNRASHLNGCKCCKHSIAVATYAKIMRNRLNATIHNREIDLGILHTGEFAAYADNQRMGMVHLRKSGATYDFCETASMVRFSLWLAAQQPVAVEWPTSVTVAA